MPLYEYGCSACGHIVELMQSASLAKAPDACEKCGSSTMEKMLSRTSFILKGDGWYKDGYSKGSAPNKDTTAASSSESTPSTSSDSSTSSTPPSSAPSPAPSSPSPAPSASPSAA
ncbi:zinc ribbon domain-containing protein [Myxococcota bacterium]|nr:zinc ribbon domain-containing protein [Myxococcota bacterium]